ncbi:DNA-entry nuclease [Priestia megaterium]|nr:DNA-entry nuclease [Priestia megaterium]
MKKIISTILLLALAVIFVIEENPFEQHTATQKNMGASYDEVIYFPADKYPETADHIEQAIEEGESAICTIDRDGAKENRSESLRGIPTKKGYDRDEFPMAMCEEGGAGADIEYVTPSDNRGAGSWVSHQLDEFPDGTRVLIEVE